MFSLLMVHFPHGVQLYNDNWLW